eukprot:scaffold9278_cov136-Skeletonema_marinoi.AAC.1
MGPFPLIGIRKCDTIGGHPGARHNLGCEEEERGRIDRAVKHWIIAAKLGDENSMQNVKEAYRGGLVSKEDFASALRSHQSAVDATQSPQRETAERFWGDSGEMDDQFHRDKHR